MSSVIRYFSSGSSSDASKSASAFFRSTAKRPEWPPSSPGIPCQDPLSSENIGDIASQLFPPKLPPQYVSGEYKNRGFPSALRNDIGHPESYVTIYSGDLRDIVFPSVFYSFCFNIPRGDSGDYIFPIISLVTAAARDPPVDVMTKDTG